MRQVIGKFTVKKIVWFAFAAIMLYAIDVIVTSKVSTAHNVAQKEIFKSNSVSSSTGQVQEAILFSSRFKFTGSAGCSYLSYFVIRERGVEVVQVRLRKSVDVSEIWTVEESILGFWSDFKYGCFS
jgi:hypothetical protein